MLLGRNTEADEDFTKGTNNSHQSFIFHQFQTSRGDVVSETKSLSRKLPTKKFPIEILQSCALQAIS